MYKTNLQNRKQFTHLCGVAFTFLLITFFTNANAQSSFPTKGGINLVSSEKAGSITQESAAQVITVTAIEATSDRPAVEKSGNTKGNINIISTDAINSDANDNAKITEQPSEATKKIKNKKSVNKPESK